MLVERTTKKLCITGSAHPTDVYNIYTDEFTGLYIFHEKNFERHVKYKGCIVRHLTIGVNRIKLLAR